MKKITLKYLVVLLYLLTMTSFAQQKCATDELAEIERQKNPTFFDQNRTEIEKFTSKFAKNNSTSKSATTTTIIPTVVHVVHNGEAVGTYPNISDAQILSAISNLNDAFKNTSIYAGSLFYNTPMDIEFVLAKVKENGTPTTGIERYDVTGKAYASEYNNNGIKGETTGVVAETLFKDFYWNPQDYMNVWVVKKIDGIDTGTGASGTLGYATFPGTFPGVSDGLVCQARAFGYNPAYNATNPGATPGFDFGSSSEPSSGNGTADHEVGHYLNLQHTFTGDNNGTTCPADTTVGVDSDGCADIAPHKRTDSVCPADSATANTCTGGPNEYIHNFMDYSSDNCFTGFSGDQRTRVYATLDGPRSAFKTAVGHVAPSGNYPAAVTNAPVRVDPLNSGLGIFEVTLNGNSYKSLSAHNDGFYLNRVASQPATTLVASTNYAMTVKVGVGGTNKELVDVYIDYNNDGAFNTTNERVYQTAGGSGLTNGGVHTFSFTTPATGGFVNGQKLRMRVISDFDNNVDPVINPYTTDSGNIEDYSVIFNPTLSVESNQINSDKVQIYPNPTKNILNINNETNSEITSISIIDALGRHILKSANTNTISVANLNNGVYFLKLEFKNNSIVTKRFIKQ